MASLLKSLWEELMMSLFLQIGTMCPQILLFLILIEFRVVQLSLGRPFLRTIGVVIDMKEGNIKFQFPLRKDMSRISGSGRPSRFELWGARGDHTYCLPVSRCLSRI